MNQQRASSSNFRQAPGILTNSSTNDRFGGQVNLAPSPPPVPPRRPATGMASAYQPYGSVGPGYLGGYTSNYGPFSPYNSYNSYNTYPYRSSYGHFHGPSGDAESRLIQFAEEKSRPAFESIEAVIHTFSSMTMMLESTFFAMSSSFRAILSVADNIGRARNMFSEIMNTFALIKFTRALYRWILFKLGLRPDDPNIESVWHKAVLETINGEKTGPSTWPIFLFLSLLFGIPYLIHKIVKNMNITSLNDNNPKEWLKMNDPVFTATAIYDFQAVRSSEMSIRAGQKVWLAPESIQPKNHPGWCQATDGSNTGLIPTNYIQIVGEMKKKINQNARLKESDTKYNLEESFESVENEKHS